MEKDFEEHCKKIGLVADFDKTNGVYRNDNTADLFRMFKSTRKEFIIFNCSDPECKGEVLYNTTCNKCGEGLVIGNE